MFIHNRNVRFITNYSDQSEEKTTLVIPEDLTALSDEDLQALHTNAVESFDAIYSAGNLSEEDVDTLSDLTEGLEALNSEINSREEAAAQRAERAAELASRVLPSPESKLSANTDEDGSGDEDDDGEGDTVDSDDDSDENDNSEDEGAADTVVASAQPRRALRSELRVSVTRRNAKQAARGSTPQSMKDVAFATEAVAGFASGQGVDWDDLGVMGDQRLRSYNAGAYEAAHRAKKSLRHTLSLATFRNPLPEDLIVGAGENAQAVIDRAVDQSRLKGNSLVAAGGWCAPSETLYDLLELESTDGIISIPEIGISRGGINRTLGPDWRSIFASDVGFSYTEAEDIDGDYDGEGGGTKPCYPLECDDGFEDFRLNVAGVCITGGLLQARGYPELVARTIRGVLVAHEHKMAGRYISAIEAGSTAVTMPARPGALTPTLDAIELQSEHFRYTHRLARNTVLEAKFPFWVRGAIRSDLARKAGLDLFSVTDAQINAWFSSRQIAPDFVYNWQDITGNASAFTQWPTSFKFLLYPAGTWIKGVADVITLDMLYDSTLLATNDYTALFTEQGWMIVKMGHDSRVVTVPICPDGSASAGVLFDCNGALLSEEG